MSIFLTIINENYIIYKNCEKDRRVKKRFFRELNPWL